MRGLPKYFCCWIVASVLMGLLSTAIAQLPPEATVAAEDTAAITDGPVDAGDVTTAAAADVTAEVADPGGDVTEAPGGDVTDDIADEGAAGTTGSDGDTGATDAPLDEGNSPTAEVVAGEGVATTGSDVDAPVSDDVTEGTSKVEAATQEGVAPVATESPEKGTTASDAGDALVTETQLAGDDVTVAAPAAAANVTSEPEVEGVTTKGAEEATTVEKVVDIGDKGPTDKVTEEAEVTSQETEKTAAEATEGPSVTLTVDTGEKDKPDAPAAPKRHFTISSILVYPYLMKNPDASENSTGSEQYIGYIKDILDALMGEMNADYTIQLVGDDSYGTCNSSKCWGMIGEVKEGRVDMAAAPLTVTLQREQYVDFTYRFQSFEAVIILRRRHPEMEPRITSLEDLLAQDEVKYGVTRQGVLFQNFRDSKGEMEQKLWKSMERMDAFTDSNQDGVNRARNSHGYAFLLEGSLAEMVLNHEPCDLEGIKTGLFRRQYAIAIPNRSELRDQLNAAIVKLVDEGKLEELIQRWINPGMCAVSGASSALWGVTSLVTSLLVAAWLVHVLSR